MLANGLEGELIRSVGTRSMYWPYEEDVLYQPDAVVGLVSLVTHWTIAEYDDVSLKQLPR